eukprot:6494078-Pyramimonas_sp.AAC.1
MQTDRQTARLTAVRAEKKQTDIPRQTDSQPDRQTDRQTSKQTDKQTEKQRGDGWAGLEGIGWGR